MILIDEPRAEDDLDAFGTLLRFAGLVYEDEDEGQADAAFQPNLLDGGVGAPADRSSADAAFDACVEAMKAAEGQFLEDGEEEAMVGLFDTPHGLLLVVGTTMMGFDHPDLAKLLPGRPVVESMAHVSPERIRYDLLGIRE